jgi:hypothetical protein
MEIALSLYPLEEKIPAPPLQFHLALRFHFFLQFLLARFFTSMFIPLSMSPPPTIMGNYTPLCPLGEVDFFDFQCPTTEF